MTEAAEGEETSEQKQTQGDVLAAAHPQGVPGGRDTVEMARPEPLTSTAVHRAARQGTLDVRVRDT